MAWIEPSTPACENSEVELTFPLSYDTIKLSQPEEYLPPAWVINSRSNYIKMLFNRE